LDGRRGAHVNYGNLLKDELDRLAEARDHYEEALRIAPDHHVAHNNYASLLSNELGRFEETEHHYEETLRLDPGYTRAHYHYGRLLHRELDRWEEAIAHLDEAVGQWAISGDFDRALLALRRLVNFHREAEDWEAVIDCCDRADDLLEEAEGVREEQRFFEGTRVLATPEETKTLELYVSGLTNVLHANRRTTIDLFAAAWDRREEYETGTTDRETALAAGVALTAMLELTGVSDVGYSVEGVLGAIDPDELVSPASLLYDRLRGDTPDATPEKLRSEAAAYGDNEAVSALRARAVAALLEALR